MVRRPRHGLLAALLLAACSEKPPPRLIVLISVDTLSRAALRGFNSDAPELSHIDNFTRDSTVFPEAYSTSSWTLPAHASILTGVYPDKHLAKTRDSRLSSDVWKLAPALREAGYTTIAYTGGAYVSDFYFGEGFHRYNEKSESAGPELHGLPRDGRPSERSGKGIFDRAVATLEGFRPDEDPPLFLFVHTFAVHDYFFQNPWALRAAGMVRDTELDAVACLQGRLICSRLDWARLHALYTAEIQHLDRAFGRLLAAVDAATRDNVVVFLSDHGEGFDFANHRVHHGGRLHNDLIHVPLIVRGRGMKPGARARNIVSLADVAPTVAQWAGVTPPALDGVSFAVLGPPRPRVVFAMEHFHWWQDSRRRDVPEPPKRPLMVAATDGDDAYIASQRGPEELYDVRSDPRQLHNLAPLVPDLVLDKHRVLAAERVAIDSPTLSTDVPDRVKSELEALGYIEPGK